MVTHARSLWSTRQLGLNAGEKLKKFNYPAHRPLASFPLSPVIFGPPIVGKSRKRGENGTVCGA
uniref:Uncharacterized protein n=1 Tax=Siphoviridae sp. ctvGX2 TaxID=2826512 RepID=A0A8S5LZA0_9CAUD|nr:MAG TPA: hypothetical protein [Siphoviridae sp. ctvGX2]